MPASNGCTFAAAPSPWYLRSMGDSEVDSNQPVMRSILLDQITAKVVLKSAFSLLFLGETVCEKAFWLAIVRPIPRRGCTNIKGPWKPVWFDEKSRI